MNFYDKLRAAWRNNDSLVCVGLDPDPAKLPACVRGLDKPVFAFNKAIIDATKDLVCAYKPQAACYAAQDADDQLAETIRYIHEVAPTVPVILDAKRADIGNTTRMYAAEAFERYQADAVTVNPYMGMDAIKPFLDCADKGVVVLCRTSNGGAKEIQELVLQNGELLYQYLAERISTVWNYNHNVLLVTGATCPAELGEIRKRVGDSVALFVPGTGAHARPPHPPAATATAPIHAVPFRKSRLFMPSVSISISSLPFSLVFRNPARGMSRAAGPGSRPRPRQP